MPRMSNYSNENADQFHRRIVGRMTGGKGSMVKAASKFIRTQSQKEGKKEAEKY